MRRLRLLTIVLAFASGALGSRSEAEAALAAVPSTPGIAVGGPVVGRDIGLTYHVAAPRPNTHELAVRILVEGPPSGSLDFSMPAWSPGRYVVYDFAKHVRNVRAAKKGGIELPVSRLDKDTWRVDKVDGDGILFTYTVYCNHLSGTHSQVAADYLSLNGASIFMWVEGYAQNPIDVWIDPPPEKGWDIVTGLSQTKGFGRYRADDYEHLIDSPIVCGKLERYRFLSHEKPVYVVVNQPAATPLLPRLVENLRKIVDAAGDIFGGLPFDHYTFFFHFGRGPGEGDGMEHRNSTQLVHLQRLETEAVLDWATSVGAHEFFHTWNVKRIRPAELKPYDLSKETYLRSLWIAEGITRYYQHVLQLRAGIYDEAKFRRIYAAEIDAFEALPGRKITSAEEASLLTWFWRTDGEERDDYNTEISYYNKGGLLGLLLDLDIRRSTKGEKGLDDVFRRLFVESEKNLRGYTGADFEKAVEAVAGARMKEFFERYVAGTDPLPYAEYARGVGFVIENRGAPRAFLGARAKDRRISGIELGSPAALSGLQTGDLIDALGGEPFKGGLDAALAKLAPGTKTTIKVTRAGTALTFNVELGTRRAVAFVFEDDPTADEAATALRRAFLAGGVKK